MTKGQKRYAVKREHILAVNAAYRQRKRQELAEIKAEYLITGVWKGYPAHHPEVVAADNAKRYRADPEGYYLRSRAYIATHREENRVNQTRYRAKPETKSRTNFRERERQRTDYNYNMLRRVRRRLFAALTGLKVTKSSFELLGCDRVKLREHIESQFTPGMSWENKSLWHVDHIWPLKHFDLTDEVQLAKASHFGNLRPLWAEENRKRAYHMNEEEQARFDAWKATL